MLKKKALCLLTAAALLTAGCGSKDTAPEAGPVEPMQIRFVLDWTPNTNHTGLYVAQALGYYEEAGLTVEIIQPPEDGALALVGAGRAEFCVDFQESLGPALAAETPLPVTAVAAIIINNTSGIVSLKEDNILSPRDLEGRRCASWGTPVADAIMRSVVEADGGDIDKVQLIPSTITDVVSALQADVDAVWIFEAWDGIAVQLAGLETNYMAMADLDAVFNFYTPIIAAGNDFLETHPEQARAFLQATARGYEYAAAHPGEAADILLEAVPELSEDLVREGQALLAEKYIDDAPYWGFIDSARWGNFYSWMYEEGLLERELGTTGFTNDYLVEAKNT